MVIHINSCKNWKSNEKTNFAQCEKFTLGVKVTFHRHVSGQLLYIISLPFLIFFSLGFVALRILQNARISCERLASYFRTFIFRSCWFSFSFNQKLLHENFHQKPPYKYQIIFCISFIFQFFQFEKILILRLATKIRYMNFRKIVFYVFFLKFKI